MPLLLEYAVKLRARQTEVLPADKTGRALGQHYGGELDSVSTVRTRDPTT